MLEPRYILALCVLFFWIVVRIFLMYRRNVLQKRRQEREIAEARAEEQTERIDSTSTPPLESDADTPKKP